MTATIDLQAKIYEGKQQRAKIQQAQDRRFSLNEKRLSKFPEDIVADVRNHLVEEHRDVFRGSILDHDLRLKIIGIMEQYVADKGLVVPGYSSEQMIEHLSQEICGLSVLDPLLFDDSITDIMVNSFDEIWVTRNGRDELTNVKFDSEAHSYSIAKKILNAASSAATTAKPLVDTSLPDTRINIAMKEIAKQGTAITVRKHPKKLNFTEDDLIKNGVVSADMLELMKILVIGRINGALVGATGSGKTTTLKILFRYLPNHQRTLTIEDTEELRLKQLYPEKHIISMVTRESTEEEANVDLHSLLVGALRQFPKRIIVGEVRDESAFTMIEAFNTGHPGSWVSLHADSVGDAIGRLITMILRSGVRMDHDEIGRMVTKAMDVIMFQEQLDDGTRRVAEIAEVIGYENGKPVMNSLFKFEVYGVDDNGKFIGDFEQKNKLTLRLAQKMFRSGVSFDRIAPFANDEALEYLSRFTKKFNSKEVS